MVLPSPPSIFELFAQFGGFSPDIGPRIQKLATKSASIISRRGPKFIPGGDPLEGAPGDTLAIQVSCAIRETHSLSAEVVQHPIERGADVADHRRIGPKKLSMDAIFTDVPIAAAQEILLSLDGEARDRYQRLEDLFNSGTPFDVATSFKFYSNMVFTSLTATRDKDTQELVGFTAEIEEVIFVDAKTVPIQLAPPKQQDQSDLGPKTTKKADAAAAAGVQNTAALSGLNALGGPAGLVSLISGLGG